MGEIPLDSIHVYRLITKILIFVCRTVTWHNTGYLCSAILITLCTVHVELMVEVSSQVSRNAFTKPFISLLLCFCDERLKIGRTCDN